MDFFDLTNTKVPYSRSVCVCVCGLNYNSLHGWDDVTAGRLFDARFPISLVNQNMYLPSV